MQFIGLDAGSVSVKVVVLDENGKKLSESYKKHLGNPLKVAFESLKEASVGRGNFSLSVTGSTGRLLASILGIKPINEIVAQAYSIRKLHPHIKSVIEMGGEDSKLIILEDGIKYFNMNSVCAAGTGSFLDQQADRLRLTIDEFSDLALKSKKPPRIAGRCSVFAKSDMIHLQQIATPVNDIVAGLCFAVTRNFKGTISKAIELVPPVSFQGGVAANKGMVRAFKEVFELDELFVPPDFSLMGAWGAALKAKDDGIIQNFDINAIEDFLKKDLKDVKGHKPLIEKREDFFRKQTEHSLQQDLDENKVSKINAYMGIDVGSISTNLALIDEYGRLISERYLMTAGRPIEAVMQGLREIDAEVRDKAIIMGVGTTGSGRYMIADYVGADIVKNEITAQATAASFIDKTVDTIFEIGGQDSKYISLSNGVIVDFEMNKACAAGTGSFLEEQAEKLNISIKNEFARLAFSSINPLKLGERCTVFMENSLMANLQKGSKKEDLLAGLAYSIVQNYINRVVSGKHIGNNIFFQGGVALNKSVVAAFEKYLNKKITVPPHHDVTGAIGMALISMRHMKKVNFPSKFKGFELYEKKYRISTFECNGCPNVCEINRIKIEGEEGNLFYGGRCEKYDTRKKKNENKMPDLFLFRDEMLWKAHLKYSNKLKVTSDEIKDKNFSLITNHSSLGKIGIPYIFFFHDFLPFWTTFLWELGFEVEVSPKTTREIIKMGLESVLAEPCFPVKVAHGHIKYLINKNVDVLFLPSFININKPHDEFSRGIACPYIQTIPYVSKTAFKGLKLITPVINTGLGKEYIEKELSKVFMEFGIQRKVIKEAIRIAEKAQENFETSVKEKGGKILSNLHNRRDEKAIVILGRSYNAFEKGINLEIPDKLANLGMTCIPMDFLPIEDVNIMQDWPNMYWRSGQKILRAVRFIKEHPKLYPVYIGNFLCGPDSFILKYVRKELASKSFLHIEIDEHSADAGAITRCEAFLDSIQNKVQSSKLLAQSENKTVIKNRSASFGNDYSKRIIYIPHMSDHAFSVQAAFERSGIHAEVLPEPDKETVDIGMQYVSGKECYPCVVTTGDMLKKVFSKDFNPAESAFFMPSGTGPCRFGQYNVFHRHVLESIGLSNVPIFAPNQDFRLYKDIRVINKDFALNSWKGIIAIDLLYKCLHETRPYEKKKGVSDRLYNKYLSKLLLSLKGQHGIVENVLSEAREAFKTVPRYDEIKPLIGIVGEIFVRTNRFSNEDLIKKIEALGGEALLAPFEEWINYLNYVNKRKAFIKKNLSEIINIYIKKFFQKKIEHKYSSFFKGFLRNLREPSLKEITNKASCYVPDSFEGETVLSIGKSIDFAEKGASGIVNTMPFGCMPGNIVTALMRGVSKNYDVPSISIPYDGTESSTVIIQLEAFMDQAKTKFMRR